MTSLTGPIEIGLKNHIYNQIFQSSLYIQPKMEPDKYSHYYKSVKHLETIDVYRVLNLFEVNHPSIQHAVKKLLVAGGRGAKNTRKDVEEAIVSLNRWLEMDEEDVKGR